jgi:hypothetical protein
VAARPPATTPASGTSRIPGPILRWLGGLRFPTLFLITAGLFVLDLFMPDLIPFADEILLGLGTLLLGRLRRPGRGTP